MPYALALRVAWFSELWADLVSGKMPMATITGVRLTRRNMFFDPSVSLKEFASSLAQYVRPRMMPSPVPIAGLALSFR